MTYERLPLKPWHYGEPMDCWLYPHVREKLGELIERHGVATVLEIGTAYGCSAIWFAQRPGMWMVTCVDLWGDIPEHGLFRIGEAFVENLHAARAGVTTLRGDSHDEKTLRQVLDGPFIPDLVYLDGDHSYEGVKQDIEMYGPLARKVLCGDDYDAEVPGVAGVIRAVDELLPNRQTHGRLWYVEK